METTDFCSYELSKRLKGCGFNEPCDHLYNCHGNLNRYADTDRINRNTNGHHTPSCSAPTLAHAQKWLREKLGIYAYCEPNCLKKWFARAIDLAKNEDLLFDGEMFDNFEKAFEYAISAALELIKKGE